MERNAIVVVSGLPRSGTSMMMKMLEAGGLGVLTDDIRTADLDNPKGYYEFERVKQIETDQAWLPEAQGKAVKMIAALLKHLPTSYRYKIVFMRRDMSEILASQKQMLVHRGEPSSQVSDDHMSDLFEKHLTLVESWLDRQPNMDVLYVHYRDVLDTPAEQAQRINRFLGGALDEAQMATVVDPQLHRQKA